MKSILIFGAIGMFAYVAFIPPEGMTKFPIAKVEFKVEIPQGKASATVQPALLNEEKDEESEEDDS